MELTNEQRKYFGIELVDPSWDRVEIPCNSVHPELSDHNDIVYFDGDTIRKVIWVEKNGGFRETSQKLKTLENRTMLAPLTSKGKAKKLNMVNIQRCSAYGTYLSFYIEDDGTASVVIGNYDTQKTYYSSRFAGVKMKPEEFIEDWIANTTAKDLQDLQDFSNATRKHCKFKEGDFFRFKYDRKHYGYGRVLMDVYKWIKDGGEFWNILMGRPVCVSLYHIVTEDPNVSIGELAKLQSCPSEYIMDNIFFYGDYEVIGNAPLPEEIDYPIMYGRSISFTDPDKICLSIGKLYREIPLKRNNNPGREFINNGIGFAPNINMNVMKQCAAAGNNNPFWEYQNGFKHTGDIRNPKYAKELAAMKKLFKL